MAVYDVLQDQGLILRGNQAMFKLRLVKSGSMFDGEMQANKTAKCEHKNMARKR